MNFFQHGEDTHCTHAAQRFVQSCFKEADKQALTMKPEAGLSCAVLAAKALLSS